MNFKDNSKNFQNLDGVIQGNQHYYYLKVYQYGESNFQEYSIDYSFPVAVSAETISPDSLEASNGNEAFTFASNVDIIDEETDLTADL